LRATVFLVFRLSVVAAEGGGCTAAGIGAGGGVGCAWGWGSGTAVGVPRLGACSAAGGSGGFFFLQPASKVSITSITTTNFDARPMQNLRFFYTLGRLNAEY
jgi:hypothetical protein